MTDSLTELSDAGTFRPSDGALGLGAWQRAVKRRQAEATTEHRELAKQLRQSADALATQLDIFLDSEASDGEAGLADELKKAVSMLDSSAFRLNPTEKGRDLRWQ